MTCIADRLNISLEPIYKELTSILDNKTINKALAQNVSLCIGKLGWVDPKSAAAYLHYFIKPWCISLRYVSHSLEKPQAFQGICEIIKANPQGVIEHFDFLWEAFAEYENPPVTLQEEFKAILNSFKDSSGESWTQFYSAFPEELQHKLTQKFGI